MRHKHQRRRQAVAKTAAIDPIALRIGLWLGLAVSLIGMAAVL